MIAKVKIYDYKDVCEHIDHIIALAAKGNVHDMVYAMKEFVPEYKSQHSSFESIDKEIAAIDQPQSDPSRLQTKAE